MAAGDTNTDSQTTSRHQVYESARRRTEDYRADRTTPSDPNHSRTEIAA
jgi:hypothetical protein